MEIFVGTSGWSNPIWNPEGFEWYVEYSGLPAIELEMSFHKIPKAEQISLWAEHNKTLRWTIKVNRSITHFFRLNDHSLAQFKDFQELFAPLDKQIDFYVFKLPPNFHPKEKEKVENFFKKTGLGQRFALQVSNAKWFSSEILQWARKLGLTIVSTDEPFLPRAIVSTNDTVFLRLAGRSDWFLHHYTKRELATIAEKILSLKPKKIFAFLDNGTAQLKNAKSLLQILTEKSKEQING